MDTSALLALIDDGHPDHQGLRRLWEVDPGAWMLPWAVLRKLIT